MNGASPTPSSNSLHLERQPGPQHNMDLSTSPISPSNFISQHQDDSAIKRNGAGITPNVLSDSPSASQSIPGPSRSRKRKRRMPPQPDEFCSKCKRHVVNNADGAHEQLLSCYNCGKSEHPSCTGKDSRWARSWDWVCHKCKHCEICEQVSVNDGELLSCGRCDRGWHLSCLVATTGQTEPPDLPSCPECRIASTTPPSLDAIKSPPFILKPVQGSSSVGKRSESPLGHLTETTTARRRSRKQDSISSFASKLRLTPAEHHPKLPSIDHEPKLPLISIKASTAESSKAKTQPPIRLRLPPKKKGEPPAESPKRRAFEEILTPEEADTSKTAIGEEDKKRFERSKDSAELRLGVPLVPPPGTPMGVMTPVLQPQTPKALPHAKLQSTANGSPSLGATRPLRTALSMPHLLPTTPTPSTPKAYPVIPFATGTSSTSPLRIKTIRIGIYEVDTWYDAPFPEEYAAVPDGKLYMCEFCLKYMKSPFGAARHRTKCTTLHPPGDEVYRDGSISIFEVDGRLNKIYCQNLCLLSKMFLDHKSLFYDVEPFLFYVMTEVDSDGAHFVGYFSKEKRSPKDFNVSCIMTLPVRQKSGWGNLLIDFSYLLTTKECRYGTPERPLSKLGAIAYGRYWQLAVYKVLRNADPDGDLRMEDICRQTRMTLEDVFNTLRTNDLITLTGTPSTPQNGRVLIPLTSVQRNAGLARKNLIRKNSSNPKLYSNSPQSSLLVYDLTSVPTNYTIHWDRRVIKEFLEKVEAKGLAKLRPENLRWSPYLIGRVRKSEPGAEEGNGRWKLELEDIPEPSMHSHTPLEPVERLPPVRSHSGLKTPKRNGVAASGSRQGSAARPRAQREGSPVTSVGQLSLGEWQEEPMEEEDDDEFQDDASTSPELRKPLRQRSSGNVSRLLARQSKATDEGEEESEVGAAWKDGPRRTRSGKVLASMSPGFDSDWEEGIVTRRSTRSKSHATRSTRRGESLAPSNSASQSEFQDEANVQEQLGLDDSPYSLSNPLPSLSKKRTNSKRVIKSPSESGDDVPEEETQPWHPFTQPDSPVLMVKGQGYEGDATPHAQSEVHGNANGVASDDQLPQTPYLFGLEEQSHLGPSDLQDRHQQGNETFEWVKASYNAPTPQFHDPHMDSFMNGVGIRSIDTASTPLLHSVDKFAPQQQQQLLSHDGLVHSAPADQRWPVNGDGDAVDAMDTCDEDAEGEDEDAEGEEDLTIMA